MKFLTKIFLDLSMKINYPCDTPDLDLRLRLPKNNLKKIRVLNVGVGSGLSGLAFQLYFLKFKQLDNIDVHLPYLEVAKKRFWRTKKVNFVNLDIRDKQVFDYDVVLMFDVLEHLPKEDSLKIIDKIKCRQIIFIPLEKHFRKNTFGAESQDHLSIWTENDFKERGYKTEVLPRFHREDDEFFDALWAIK